MSSAAIGHLELLLQQAEEVLGTVEGGTDFPENVLDTEIPEVAKVVCHLEDYFIPGSSDGDELIETWTELLGDIYQFEVGPEMEQFKLKTQMGVFLFT